MSNIKYHYIGRAEYKADCYAGDDCDKIEPYIEGSFEGDMGSEVMDSFNFDTKSFPIGTRILIEVPICPTCDEHDAEMVDDEGKCECGFDWNNWAECEYS